MTGRPSRPAGGNPRAAKAAIPFVLVTVLLDAMGIGLIVPVMPALLREVQGGDGDLAQAALWGGALATAFAAMQFLFGPLLGSLSDRFGRRPVLLSSMAAMSVDYVIMAVAGTIPLLLAGRILGGATAATHATAYACMADISSPDRKAANFGLVGAGFGLGFVLGPLAGGFLAEFGTRAPFWAAAALAGGNFLFGAVALPETLADSARRRFDLRRAMPWGAFSRMMRLPGLAALLWVYLIYSVAFYVYPAIWAFFAIERWAWTERTIGISLALFGVTMAVVQGWLIRIVLLRLSERGTVMAGFLLDMASFGLLAAVRNGAVALALTPIAALGAVATPALIGLASRAAPDDAQGELQGVLASLHALSMILSPPLMTASFAAFVGPGAPVYLPGAPFLVALLLMAVALAVFLLAVKRHRRGRGLSDAQAGSRE